MTAIITSFFGVKLQGLCWLGFWERGSQERDDGQDIPDGHLPMTVVHVISDVKLLQWSKWLQMDRGFSTAAKWVSLNFFKIFFFLTWTVFKVFIEFVTILLLLYVLVFWPGGMPDLSSLTRNQTHTLCTPCVGRINFFLTFYFVMGYGWLTRFW